jgi:hypothetical protein
MDIGDEDEEFTIEPVEDPFRRENPQTLPEEAPVPDPIEVPAEPEKVPV